MKNTIERNPLIPAGSELRVLLNSDHISYGEIHNLLKKKGIFVGSSDKSVTVPLLSATLLTFDQFSCLVETSIDRELRPKVKLSALQLTSQDADWITPLKNELLQNNYNICEKLDNIELTDPPNLVVHDKNKVKIPYTIRRCDYSKDWVSRELDFSGEIIIERTGNSLKLDFSSTHSCRETETINKRITSQISRILKTSGVTDSEKEKKITFGSFTNVERVRFFKRLTGGFGRTLGLGSVNDMEIGRDITGPPLPNDPQVAWMNQTVKKLKIDGEKLNNVFLISDEKYYPFYHVQRMDVTYTYCAGANEGSCRVGIYFSSSNRSEVNKDESELTFELVTITQAAKMNSDAKKQLTASLEKAVRSMVEAEFDKIAQERNASTTLIAPAATPSGQKVAAVDA